MSGTDRYVEIASGNVSNRGIVISLDTLSSYITPIEQKQELYRSYYTFDNELVEHFKILKTIKGYRGVYTLDNILFDIDKGSDSDKTTLETLRYFIEKELIEDWDIPEEYIQPWFSGSGYHVVIPNIFQFKPSKDLPTIVKSTLSTHFPLADNIYDGGRLIRVGYSYNLKTGLLKIPLRVIETYHLNHNDIQKMAKTMRTDFGHKPFNLNEEFWSKYGCPDKIIAPQKQPAIITKDPNATRIKTDAGAIVTCMQKIYHEGPVKGSRHHHILRMASSYRRHGIPLVASISALQGWAGDSIEPYGVQRQVEDVYKHGYRYGCNDHIMKKYCDPKCIYYRSKDYDIEINNAFKMEEDYIHFIKSDYADKSFDLDGLYRNQYNLPFEILPGELIILTGNTGLGKTAFAQNIAASLPTFPTLFLSLEVGQNLMFRRFMQIVNSKTKEEIMQYYTTENESLGDKLKHIHITTVSPEIDKVKHLIAEQEPRLVIIDTTDMIEVPYVNSDIEKMNRIINELKRTAIANDIIIIAIHHVRKDAEGYEVMTLEMLKGTSNVFQKADKILALEGDKDKAFRVLKSLKARDEGRYRAELTFNFDTFEFFRIAS